MPLICSFRRLAVCKVREAARPSGQLCCLCVLCKQSSPCSRWPSKDPETPPLDMTVHDHWGSKRLLLKMIIASRGQRSCTEAWPASRSSRSMGCSLNVMIYHLEWSLTFRSAGSTFKEQLHLQAGCISSATAYGKLGEEMNFEWLV